MKLRISHEHDLQALLERFDLQGCHPVRTPLPAGFRPVPSTNEEHILTRRLPYPQVVGSILHFSEGSRPDLAQPVGVLSRFINKWRQVDGLALEGSKASRTLHSRGVRPLSHLRWQRRKADHPCGYGEADWSPSAAMPCYSTAILGPRPALLIGWPSLPRRLFPSSATLPTLSV
jgi:hypothetical protein